MWYFYQISVDVIKKIHGSALFQAPFLWETFSGSLLSSRWDLWIQAWKQQCQPDTKLLWGRLCVIITATLILKWVHAQSVSFLSVNCNLVCIHDKDVLLVNECFQWPLLVASVVCCVQTYTQGHDVSFNITQCSYCIIWKH